MTILLKIVKSLLEKLLTPISKLCLVCGRRIQSYNLSYPELCPICFATIPWIIHPRCKICGRNIGCPDCNRHIGETRNYVINRSAVAYSEQMREWLAQYKFRGNEAYGPLLARMAGWAVKAMENELKMLGATGRKHPARNFRFNAVTYVPASSDRMMERGFNQARELASGVGRACRIPVLSLLERTCHTEKQSLKSRRERIQNLQGVYGPLPNSSERLITAIRNEQKSLMFKKRESLPFRIVLVDDVYTTGSTVSACANVLHNICASIGCPVEVYVITWARS